ncbi:MAG: methylenetetrahydrofolate reductase [NAD(P)H] [Acidobacteriota bacterium]
MKFSDYYGRGQTVISFELFPPKTEKGLSDLEGRLPKLISLQPSFITVTYGALGSTRERTLEVVSKIKNDYGQEAVHHLTCVGSKQSDIEQRLQEIREHNIENIVALRGDPPQGTGEFRASEGGYQFADQLVRHIRRFGGYGIAVAGYPEKHVEAPDIETDLQNLKRKVEAGADAVITQLFYENSHFYRFLERCRALGIEVPIIPGLLPILSVQQIKRITGLCGCTIPADLLQKLEKVADRPDEVAKVGVAHTAAQARDLLESGVEGIHFYVLNQDFHIAEIMNALPRGHGRFSVSPST